MDGATAAGGRSCCLPSMDGATAAGGRSCCLPSLAQARHDRQGAMSNLQAADALFRAMRVPRYIAQTLELAKELGISLGESTSTPRDLRNHF
jgi:hypothetical protein